MEFQKEVCWNILMDILERKKIDTIKRAAAALGIKRANAKNLLSGLIDDFSAREIINYTALAIVYEVNKDDGNKT